MPQSDAGRLLMPIICISRSAFSGGEQLAVKLAKELGHPCLSREELVKAATEAGIRVGKLEMAAVKPREFGERLAREREHYLAFTSTYLCERAREGGLVYHGRTGHLLLSGISHVLRVRVTSSEEHRVRAAEQHLAIDRDRAQRYVEQVDEDWRQWARTLYGRSWEDVLEYDVTFNLEKVSAENAAASIVSVSQLPEFRQTPASRQALENLYLGARARLLLARDERISCNSLAVRANDGVLTISYLPQEWRCAEFIPEVLAELDGVREVRTTMASTNILWIQETFDAGSDSFREVVEIATKWNAAVEPIRLVSSGGENGGDAGSVADSGHADRRDRTGPIEKLQELSDRAGPAFVGREGGAACGGGALDRGAYDGGVEDDDVDGPSEDDGGLARVVDELARAGRSGGGQVVRGGGQELLASIDRLSPYTLAVIGDVFLNKGPAARKRLTRDLRSLLSERLKKPVVTTDELKARYLFTGREAVKAGVYLVLMAALFVLVFTHQQPVMRFLAGAWGDGSTVDKAVVSLTVFLIVPLAAHTYGSFAKILFKLIKME
jgi:cytidylate kinase